MIRTLHLAAILLLSVLLGGCQQSAPAPRPSLTNLCQPGTASDSAACVWNRAMQHQLNHDFRDAARYAGQQCLVQLVWQNTGRYAVMQTQGDEALCLRAWQLIGQSHALPPPPDRQQPAWFGFSPSRVNSPAPPAATGAG
ncbi:colicin transporter [Pantoea eucrina]|uniref:Colicin transporter n=1 Tax=Pantoea eucrina TaxID=472693 RepID=A0ABU5LH46_9GAMM|nr:cell envelope integrity TolA C-terminal domain-containing protein [Pantoea eucrina]MDZ7279264.1 colicin transporter [Pantoea eucrina]